MRPEIVLSLFVSLVFAACSGGDDHAPKPGDGHDHSTPGHDHAHAERVALGEVKIGDHTLSVFQVTKLVPGNEGDFDLEVAAGKPLPEIVRGWIGVESGKGSMKVKFGKETATRMHGHPEVPNPIPPDSLLWLEIESASGTSTASVAFRP